MRKSALAIIIALLSCLYWYINRQGAAIIDVHYNGHTAEVLVDRLPFSGWAKIRWWEKNQGKIRSQYHIPAGNKGPALITVYAFGEGYKALGKEELRCFDEVKPPRNCIERNILMAIWTTREGRVEYEI